MTPVGFGMAWFLITNKLIVKKKNAAFLMAFRIVYLSTTPIEVQIKRSTILWVQVI